MGGYEEGNPNSGHGHVFKRPDGMLARCGGPAMCQTCAGDAARKAGLIGATTIAQERELELLRKIEALVLERDGEREARHKADMALRMKDEAMQVLFDRMRAAGVDYSDLIP